HPHLHPFLHDALPISGVPAPADTHVDALQERQVKSAIPKMNVMQAAADPDSAYVRIANLTKRFGDFVAVDDISLDIRRGLHDIRSEEHTSELQSLAYL